MKLLQRITIVLFVLVTAMYGFTQVKLRHFTDRTPPVISFDSDIVVISSNSGDQGLLQGVTATDKEDGDVTDKLVVQGVTQLLTKNTAKVTYAVFDSANNFATATRTVQYSDYEKPRFQLHQPLVFPLNQAVDIAKMLTATDLRDGDISANIRISSSSMDVLTPGLYTVTAQAINSLSDTEILPLKVIISGDAIVEPSFLLSDYVVYLNVGDPFDAQSYVQDVDGRKPVQADGSAVDTSTPGIYHVAYSHNTDSNVFTVYQTVVVR